MIRPILYASTVMAALVAAAATASAAPLLLSGNPNSSTLNGVMGGVDVVSTKPFDTLNTAPSFNFNNTTVPTPDVEIAALTLTFNSTTPTAGPTDVSYDLILTLSKPTVATYDFASMPLVVTYNSTTGTYMVTGFSLPTDAILPDDIVLSDFTFTTSGTGAPTFSGNTWTITDPTVGDTAVLEIFADVSVPEPASLAIFGTALAGFGLLLRRRKNG